MAPGLRNSARHLSPGVGSVLMGSNLSPNQDGILIYKQSVSYKAPERGKFKLDFKY